MSLVALALTTAISSLISKSRNGSQSNDSQLQQRLLEQERQKEEDRKRRQNTMIIIGVSAFLIIGAIIAFTAIQKGNQIKIAKT